MSGGKVRGTGQFCYEIASVGEHEPIVMHTPRFVSAFLVIFFIGVVAAQADSVAIHLDHATVALYRPWRFHFGDDLRWAQPGYNDSAWSRVDLTPPPGATDGDVGLPGYAPGFTAKGNPGNGYAWYRIHVHVNAPTRECLALLGPWAVDSIYEVYINGALVGGVGSFAGASPAAHGNHYPRMFVLRRTAGDDIVVAIRVWAGPWAAGQGNAGIHIAPAIGTRDAVTAQYQLQWLKIFEGYVVDAVPALLFFLAAGMVLCLWPFDPGDKSYFWLPIALMLSGIQRGNQAFFFWWQIETVQEFVIFIIALVGPLALGAWMMAWRSWFKLERPRWMPSVVAALTLALIILQLLARPWIFDVVLPRSLLLGVQYLISAVRLAFVLVFVLIALLGVRSRQADGWYAMPAMLAIGGVLFTAELVEIHVPGIWFPFGVGLSLSEIASVALVVLLSALLLRRLWSYAPRTAVSRTVRF